MEYFPRIQNVAAQSISRRVTVEIMTENFTGRIIFMSMFFKTSHGDQKTVKKMRVKCSTRFSFCKKIWSRTIVISSVLVRRKRSSVSEDRPQGEWDKMAEKMMLTLAESGHPVFRATSPLSRSQLKSKGGGKLSGADLETI